MNNSKFAKVLWQEGLLMAPQHLQLSDYLGDQGSHARSYAANPFYWGVKSMSVDIEALSAGIFRISKIEGHFRSGLGFEWDESASDGLILELPLGPEFDRNDSEILELFIKVPLGNRVAPSSDDSSLRLASTGPCVDRVTDAVEVSIDIGEPNLSLSAGQRPSKAYDSLYVGAVTKLNDVYTMTDDLPTTTIVPTSGPFYGNINKLLEQLRNKAGYLFKGLDTYAATSESRIDMLETRIRLNALVNAITELNIAWAIKPVATVKLFEALARVYASLSALVAGGLPLALPDYDHFRPSLALSPLVEKIAGVVSAIATAFKFIPFDETDGLFVVKVEAAPANRLLIGLKGGSEQVLESWIEGAMIASGSGFEAIRARRVLGAARTKIELSDLPEELAQSGYLIFEILNHGLSDDDCDLLIKNAAAQSAAYKPSEIVLIASMGEGETDDARPESSLS